MVYGSYYVSLCLVIVSPLSYAENNNEDMLPTVNKGVGSIPPSHSTLPLMSKRGGAASMSMKKHWISLIESPDDVTEVGAYEMARLDCAVQGADNPQIYWYKDGQPLNMNEELVELDGSSALVKVKSSLVIPCSFPGDTGVYTCVSDNGVKRRKADTTLVVRESQRSRGIGDECSQYALLTGPTILQWTKTYLGNQGTTAVLMCRGDGYKMWYGPAKKPLTSAKYKISESGDLTVMNLQWSDMGRYTCEVNLYGEIYQLQTFLYPLRVDS